MKIIRKLSLAKTMVAVVFTILAFSVSISAQTRNNPKSVDIDKGDFKVGFSPLTLKEDPNKKMDKEFAGLMLEIAKPLNELIALPYDVYLNFDKCGQPNAFYNRVNKEITMCYEFLVEFERVFKQVTKNEKEIDDMVFGAMTVFFFHELGHCLIDVWDLPATGREEDAVDQLALVILLDGTREGENMVISAATFFAIAGDEQGTKNLAFWGEHSLDQQRFYDMLCLTYGSNPTKNEHLIKNKVLPVERAVGCQDEHKRVDGAWGRLLLPYLKG
jgi:hypothetical protein